MGFYKNTSGVLTPIAGGISNSYAPIGAIYPYGGSSAPSGYLMCDGSAVSRSDYAALFAVIGTSFGSGDGSTTFNVPDLRETVPVGSGTRGSGVATHDTYTVGQFKDDQLQDHAHNGTWARRDGAYFEGAGSGYEMQDNPAVSHEGVYGARTGTTTHGKQLGVNYIIKAKDVNLSGGGQALADRVEALEAYGKKVLWTGTATKGDTITQFSVQGYDEVIAQVGGTWIRLDSGHGVGANGRKKFTGLYAGRDTAGGTPYEQYYLLDILGTGYIADCAWFNVGSLNIQNARLAGQKAIECITNSAAWSDPIWKSLADVETNVNVTRIIGVKYPLIG